MSAATERLVDGYYNSDPIDDANPGGLAGDGHVLNFPAALRDLGEAIRVAAALQPTYKAGDAEADGKIDDTKWTSVAIVARMMASLVLNVATSTDAGLEAEALLRDLADQLKADKSIQITGEGLLAGEGGDLTESRKFRLFEASEGDVGAGVAANRVLTVRRGAYLASLLLDAIYGGVSADWNTLKKLDDGKLDILAKATAAAVAAGNDHDTYVTSLAMADVTTAATGARSALGGHAFKSEPGLGLNAYGRAVGGVTVDPDGAVIDGLDSVPLQLLAPSLGFDASGRAIDAVTVTRDGAVTSSLAPEPLQLLAPSLGFDSFGRSVGKLMTASDGAVIGDTAEGRPQFQAAPSGYFEQLAIESMEVDQGGAVHAFVTPAGRYTYVPQVGYALRPYRRRYKGSGEGDSVRTDAQVCRIFAGFGQSNELCWNRRSGNPVIISSAPVYPEEAVMPVGGPRLWGGVSGLMPLVESADVTTPPTDATWGMYETAMSAWANTFIRLTSDATGERPKVAAFATGYPGLDMAHLFRGSRWYDNLLNGLYGLCAAIRARGWLPIVEAVNLMQGEANVTPAFQTATERCVALNQFHRDISADAQDATGQVEPVLLFVDAIGLSYEPFYHPIWSGDSMAAANNPHIKLTQPTYQFPRSPGDDIHLSPLGQYRRGVGLGRASYKELIGVGHSPLVIERVAWATATVIDLWFSHPVVIDGSGDVGGVFPSGNVSGFRFRDNGEFTPPAVTSVAIDPANARHGQVYLSASPAGPRPQLAYATEPNSGSSGGPINGARGQIRATVSVPSLADGHANYEWLMPGVFDLPPIDPTLALLNASAATTAQRNAARAQLASLGVLLGD